jgi:hypothetical protein
MVEAGSPAVLRGKLMGLGVDQIERSGLKMLFAVSIQKFIKRK